MILADGSAWSVVAADKSAEAATSLLAATLETDGATDAPNKVLVRQHNWDDTGALARRIAGSPDGVPATDADIALDMMHASLQVCSDVQSRGGVLIHGALVCRGDTGVVLAASGGTGKSTACRRLPEPWEALSDDTTLIVLTESGEYRAHPWPTWSRFWADGEGGTWPVSRSVKLAGIYCLEQGASEGAHSLPGATAACFLAAYAEQAWWPVAPDESRTELRHRRVQQFDNVCALVRKTPCFLMQISLTGTVWHEIERTLDI